MALFPEGPLLLLPLLLLSFCFCLRRRAAAMASFSAFMATLRALSEGEEGEGKKQRSMKRSGESARERVVCCRGCDCQIYDR